MVKIFIEKDNKKIDLKLDLISKNKEVKFKDVLIYLNISLSSVILIKNNEIVLEEEIVSENDDLKILSVVSGG
jgi:sulfur carrier protein ThiS